MKDKFTYIYSLIFCFIILHSGGAYAQYNTKSLNWNTKAYESLTYSGHEGQMPYRLLHPHNYNPHIKYPLVVMLHGAGEGIGACPNPDCVLVWGGKMHLDSIDKHPSFVVYPRTHGGNWDEKALTLVMGIMTHLAQTYSIDLDRIYIHGLSAGGKAVWNMALNHPQIFAAVSPMSAAGDINKAHNVIYTPIWTVQGEKDSNPRESLTMAMMNQLAKYGKHPIYTYDTKTHKQNWPSPNVTEPVYTLVPNAGHVVWPVLYDSKTWLPWLYRHKKNQIIAIGNTALGPGESVTLGVASGFLAYEWSNGAMSSEIKVNRPGSYRVRYKRYAYIWSGPQVWSAWSDPIVVTKKATTAHKEGVIDSNYFAQQTEKQDSTLGGEVTLYPNPFQTKLIIQFTEIPSTADIFIFDKYGTLIHQTNLTNMNNSTVELDISGFALKPDIYLIKVSSGNIRDKLFRVMKDY